METRIKKVIIFDDDEDILSICSCVMEEAGWQVYTFNNCNDIVATIFSIMPSVILMDNWIPNIGGVEATKVIKASDSIKHIPVVYFSAHNDIKTLSALAGAEAYLAKPFNIDDLEIVINSVLSNRSDLIT
jgi:DNA-binding NtrC family response regulator